MNRPTMLALLAALSLSGCVRVSTRTEAVRTDRISFPQDGSEALRVNLNMGAGEMRVSGGARQLAEGELEYNIPEWQPVVKYSSAAGHGNLAISQPNGKRAAFGSMVYRWNVRLADNVATDLSVQCGAGDSELRLGSMLLRGVEVNMGVGKTHLDLRGDVRRSYDVRVHGGVGEAVIRLPREVGIYAQARGGIGSIQTPGLRREGDHWVNAAYDTAKVNIRLDVSGGVGSITLDAR